MKILTTLFIQCTAIVFLLVMFNSCRNSPMDTAGISECDTDALQLTTEGFLDASAIYNQDPSIENCRTYKAAAEAYLENVRKCTLTIATGIEETEELIESLDC